MKDARLEKFQSGIIKEIAKIVGENLSGSEITELFEVAGFPEIKHDGTTKWKFLYSILKKFNQRLGGQYDIVKFIETFSNPTQWIRKEEVRKHILNELNKALIFNGLQLNQDGEIICLEDEKRGSYVGESQSIKSVSQIKSSKSSIIEPYEGIEPFIFISYSRKDKEKVYPIIKGLSDAGYNIWYDKGIPPSVDYIDYIAKKIELSRIFLIFLSPNALDTSKEPSGVINEINVALEKEKEFIIVHLAPTKIPEKLSWKWENKISNFTQAILRYDKSDEEFYKDLLKEIHRRMTMMA